MKRLFDGQCSETWRTREELRAAESRAVAIRKQLKNFQLALGSQVRGVTDDAVMLADSIERLARRGQAATAEEAVAIASQIEVLTSLLGNEIDNLPTS